MELDEEEQKQLEISAAAVKKGMDELSTFFQPT